MRIQRDTKHRNPHIAQGTKRQVVGTVVAAVVVALALFMVEEPAVIFGADGAARRGALMIFLLLLLGFTIVNLLIISVRTRRGSEPEHLGLAGTMRRTADVFMGILNPSYVSSGKDSSAGMPLFVAGMVWLLFFAAALCAVLVGLAFLA